MNRKRISIIFCGGCNPKSDLGRIAEEIKVFTVNNGLEVIFNSSDVDFIVFLSGCTVSCARSYNTSDVPCIEVAANTIDGVNVEEASVVTRIMEKVMTVF